MNERTKDASLSSAAGAGRTTELVWQHWSWRHHGRSMDVTTAAAATAVAGADMLAEWRPTSWMGLPVANSALLSGDQQTQIRISSETSHQCTDYTWQRLILKWKWTGCLWVKKLLFTSPTYVSALFLHLAFVAEYYAHNNKLVYCLIICSIQLNKLNPCWDDRSTCITWYFPVNMLGRGWLIGGHTISNET